MRVAVHELKAGLSRYLARARAGQTIEVTSHDKPVARIVGVSAEAPPGIARLVAQGAAQWAGGKPNFRPVRVRSPGKALSEIVLEDRGCVRCDEDATQKARDERRGIGHQQSPDRYWSRIASSVP